jgi:adenosylmethionine-8-amino-7-oxononanoate aminotransferase
MGMTACAGFLFDAFLDDRLERGFLHGHSFTGNPVGCAAALASLDLLESDDTQKAVQRICMTLEDIRNYLIKCEHLVHVRRCGTVLAMELPGTGGYLHPKRDALYAAFMKRGLLIRPLGNTIYLLPPYCSTDDELWLAAHAIEEVANELMKA